MASTLHARKRLPAAARRVPASEQRPAKAKQPPISPPWPARPPRGRAQKEIAPRARERLLDEARPPLIREPAADEENKARDNPPRSVSQQPIPRGPEMALARLPMPHASGPAEEHTEPAGCAQAPPGMAALPPGPLAPHNAAVPPEVALAQAPNSAPMIAAWPL